MLKNDPYTTTPASAADMNAVVVVNFDVTTKSISASFPHSGTWYDYYNDHNAVQVTGASMSVSLPPGGYKLYTDYFIGPPVTGVKEERNNNMITAYPNPSSRYVTVKKEGTDIISLSFISVTGGKITPLRVSKDSWDLLNLPTGLYILETITPNEVYKERFVKY
jgi:hypothetical protein